MFGGRLSPIEEEDEWDFNDRYDLLEHIQDKSLIGQPILEDLQDFERILNERRPFDVPRDQQMLDEAIEQAYALRFAAAMDALLIHEAGMAAEQALRFRQRWGQWDQPREPERRFSPPPSPKQD